MSDPWFKQVASLRLVEVGSVAGWQARGKAFSPCPACKATTRSRGDRRPPVGTSNGKGWQCQSCHCKGDAADAVAYAVVGKRVSELDSDEHEKVQGVCATQNLCDHRETPGLPTASRSSGATYRKKKTAKPKPPSEARRGGVRLVAHRGDGPAEVRASEEPTSSPSSSFSPWYSWDPDLPDLAEKELWSNPEAKVVLDYLTGERKLSEDALKAWHIGAHRGSGRWWVVIPLWDPTGKCVNIRFRAVPKDPDDKPKPKYMVCPGRPLPLFGAKNLGNDLTFPVIITEGELDVLALWDYGWKQSVVSGSGGASTWDEDWLDALEPYEGFVLVYDDDEAGEEAIPMVADSLGRYRCTRAVLPYKDAGECLRQGTTSKEVEKAIDFAEPLVKMQIVRPSHHARAIERSITDPNEQWRRRGMPTGNALLDDLIGGWPASVVVITGHTGSGKTSFVLWASYIQAQLGTPVLITSFENDDEDASDILLRMHLGNDPASFTPQDRTKAWGEIDQMNLHIVRHQGFTAVEQLMETMMFARRRMGKRLFIIDHLGYTIDYSAKASEVQQLDRTTKMFSAFARDERACVMMIAHPTNQHRRDDRRAYLHDAKGSVSIEQETAGGIALEIDKASTVPKTFLHVDKWRPKFGAGAGSADALYYCPLSNTYHKDWTDTPASKVQALSRRGKGRADPKQEEP